MGDLPKPDLDGSPIDNKGQRRRTSSKTAKNFSLTGCSGKKLMLILYWISFGIMLDWMTYSGIMALVTKTTIDEGSEWAVKKGATLNLTCLIAQSAQPPDYVFWYHESRMINYEYPRGDISTQKALDENMIVSRLSIKHVLKQDGGNYTCSPSNTEGASVFVHVLGLETEQETTERRTDDTSSSAAETSSAGPVAGVQWSAAPYIVPSFDNATSRNVTAQLGQTAYLHCIVRYLGDKTVSWIRRKPFHVLTVGLEVYTSDDRYQSIHMEQTSDWTLQIKYVQQRDAGMYECQVSSDPKISYFVNLTVLVAKTAINEGPEWYVKMGSSINLTCIIAQSPEPPIFVFWYHDNRMINYDPTRGEISLQKAAADMSISRLFIKNVQPQDSGNYTCGPSNAEAASITVTVLHGEKPAAMQHDGSSTVSGASLHRFSIVLVLVSSYLNYQLVVLR